MIFGEGASQVALVVKAAYQAGDIRDELSITGFGISWGEGDGNPL